MEYYKNNAHCFANNCIFPNFFTRKLPKQYNLCLHTVEGKCLYIGLDRGRPVQSWDWFDGTPLKKGHFNQGWQWKEGFPYADQYNTCACVTPTHHGKDELQGAKEAYLFVVQPSSCVAYRNYICETLIGT